MDALSAAPPGEREATLRDAEALSRLLCAGARSACAQALPASRLGSLLLQPAADPLQSPAAGAAELVGRVRLSRDPLATTGATEYSLTLAGAAAEGLPRRLGMRRAGDAQAAVVLSEVAGAREAAGEEPLSSPSLVQAPVLVDGTVEVKFDCHVLDVDAQEYRLLNRQRATAASTKTRVAMTMAAYRAVGPPSTAGGPRGGEEAPEVAPHMVPLPRRANKSAPKAKVSEKDGRSADELQAYLFEKFEAHPHLTVPQLVQDSRESVAKLRAALGKIAEMIKTPGPTKGAYQLLSHLRK